MADVVKKAGEAVPAALVANLSEALAQAEDEDVALAAVQEYLPRMGLTTEELLAVLEAAGKARETWHMGIMPQPRDLSPYAAAVMRLVTTLLVGHLRMLRMASAHAAMTEERAMLQDVTQLLNEAVTLDAAMRVFRLPAPYANEVSLTLCSVEDGPDGSPKWMTVVAYSPAVGKPSTTQLGARYHLPDIPVSRWLLASPGTPVLIGSLADDPRVDAVTRMMYARMGIGAVLMMSLTLRGRMAGTLSLTWSRPVPLGDRERRIYHALARQAALLVANNTMIEKLQAALQTTQRQEQLLGTVLDHVPVGIMCLDAPSRRMLMINRAAQVYMGGASIDVAEVPAQILYPGTDTPMPEDERPGFRAAATSELVRDELDMIPPNGQRANFEVVGVPLLDADGKAERVVVLLSDVTARKHEAESRARLQEEVIRVQAAALAERSTPLMPITDDVLVMPLIGTIDGNRGEQIYEVVLNGARSRRARITIIDVTGVRSIDTRAAEVLTGAARALRLLGVEAVLSGVNPEVAQALVALDVSLAGIVTCGSLQAGIQYALRRLGKRI